MENEFQPTEENVIPSEPEQQEWETPVDIPQIHQEYAIPLSEPEVIQPKKKKGGCFKKVLAVVLIVAVTTVTANANM